MKSNEQRIIDELLYALKSIDRKAKNAFVSKQDINQTLIMVGMIAENAILREDVDYDYRPQ